MEVRAFAGRFAPRGTAGVAPGSRALEEALRRDGPAAGIEAGPLALAWTPPGAQPASSPGGSVCVIDGRPRVGALAERLGLDPSQAAPEAVVATGFDRLREHVLPLLGGSFALVVWNRERGHGLLARDRLGERPLFLCESGGTLLFASEVRNLLALVSTAPAPDTTAMAHWLARTNAPDGRTLFSGIERLGPASALHLDRGGWMRTRYWRPRYSPPRRIEAAQAGEEVRAALGGAVERALGGASRPALMLSGGLDSAALAAVAPQPLPAYSAVFPDEPEVDESDAIARVRDRLGMHGVEERFGAASALAAAAEFMREWELPSVSPNLFVWSPLLRRAAADGVDVMLDGEGGDELFGCARYLVADRLRAARPLAALRVARSLPGMGERPRARWLARALASYGVRAALPPALHERLRGARGRSAAGPEWLAPEAQQLATADPWAWKRTRGPRWWAELASALTAGPDALGAPDQLRREARLTGVELRHPLRDPELVELVLGLPPELAFHPRLDRPLVRRALAGMLPEETLDGDRKPAFNSVLVRALEGPDATVLGRLLADPHPELARQVQRTAVEAMLAPGRRQLAWGPDLWRIATLAMWLEHLDDPEEARRRLELDPHGASIAFVEVPVSLRQLA